MPNVPLTVTVSDFNRAVSFFFASELSLLVSPDPRQHQPSADVQLDIQSVSVERPIGLVGELKRFDLKL